MFAKCKVKKQMRIYYDLINQKLNNVCHQLLLSTINTLIHRIVVEVNFMAWVFFSEAKTWKLIITGGKMKCKKSESLYENSERDGGLYAANIEVDLQKFCCGTDR